MADGHDHMAHDAAGHNHTGGDMAGGMDMGGGDMKYMASVGRRADGSYYYFHGGFDGHVLPGAFFLVRCAGGARHGHLPAFQRAASWPEQHFPQH
jgi:hypothetical protein